MNLAVAYSRTTDCSVKLPGSLPGSISERRRRASTASSTCALGKGKPSAAKSSSRDTGSRRIASHRSVLCSTGERRSNCSASSSRTPPKTTSPCFKNGAISLPKSSTIVCPTIFKASGLPPYHSINCSRSWIAPRNPCSLNICSQAEVSSPPRRKARTGHRLPSCAMRTRSFSRLVRSRQL